MARRLPTDLLQGASDLLVLSVLAGGSQYGYSIAKRVAAGSDGAVRLTPGVLYPLLHRMEKQGLLLSSWETVQAQDNPDGPGRKRKWYRLSARGRNRLTHRAAAHRAYQAIVDSFLATAEEAGG